jgi:hypothetical protein
MANEHTTIYLRAHTEPPPRLRRYRKNTELENPGTETNDLLDTSGDETQFKDGPKWPEYVLAVDVETTLDERQSLIFGFYRLCRLESDGTYACAEEGILRPDDLPEAELSILECYCADHDSEVMPGCPEKLCLISRAQFVAKMKCVAYDPPDGFGAMVCGLNLPFDLSRIAVDVREAHSRKEEWSFVLSQKPNPETGELTDDPFTPRISLTPKDSKAAFMRFTSGCFAGINAGGRRHISEPKRGRFLDLRTLGWALRSVSYSLKSAAKEFGAGIEKLKNHEPSGVVSIEELNYCRQDTRASVAVINGMKAEFDLHPIEWLKPDRVFSPASIAKAYLKEMGISNLLDKTPPKNSGCVSIRGHRTLGKAMQGYFGGRAEDRIRHTPVPVVYCDFLSEYPTVNTLMHLWNILTAETVEVVDCSSEVKQLISRVSSETVFDPTFWKKLLFFAEIVPDYDLLPTRAKYNGKSTNIGVNYLTSQTPLWYAGPDIVASKILTGKPPRVRRAFKIVAKGKQAGLKPVRLRGQVEIDPRRDGVDFFKTIIELRYQLKSEDPILAYFLKILLNAGSYGLFVEVNQEKAIDGSENIKVFSGSEEFFSNPSIIETQGAWYCPIIGSLITASGRLLLALLERTVTDLGGVHLFADTDSMAIVSSKTGGLIPCAGGPYRLPDGGDAIKTLSWAQAQSIVNKFDALIPYDRSIVKNAGKGSILKLEDVNFDENGMQREVWGLAISAKRYCLFSFQDGEPEIVAAKMHGLGFLYPPDDRKPNTEEGLPPWIREAWMWILRGALGLPRTEPEWFNVPAMMQLRITTHNVLKKLLVRQKNLPYSERVKPLNFVLSPIIHPLGYPTDCDKDMFSLIAPFTKNRESWWKITYTNIHDGERWKLRKPDAYELKALYACPKTFGDYIAEYSLHPEFKSMGPDGRICDRQTAGLLKQTHVKAAAIPQFIGKETNRRLTHEQDTRLLTESSHLEYSPSGPQADSKLAERLQRFSLGFLVDATGVSIETVRSAKAGNPLKAESRDTLWAMVERLSDHRPAESLDAKAFAALEVQYCVCAWMD